MIAKTGRSEVSFFHFLLLARTKQDGAKVRVFRLGLSCPGCLWVLLSLKQSMFPEGSPLQRYKLLLYPEEWLLDLEGRCFLLFSFLKSSPFPAWDNFGSLDLFPAF